MKSLRVPRRRVLRRPTIVARRLERGRTSVELRVGRILVLDVEDHAALDKRAVGGDLVERDRLDLSQWVAVLLAGERKTIAPRRKQHVVDLEGRACWPTTPRSQRSPPHP